MTISPTTEAYRKTGELVKIWIPTSVGIATNRKYDAYVSQEDGMLITLASPRHLGHLFLREYQPLTLSSLHFGQYRNFTDGVMQVPYISPSRRLQGDFGKNLIRATVPTRNRLANQDYTREELVVLASLRKSTGRTCRNCDWYRPSGRQRGCFPEGDYRKWLSAEEFSSGCDRFVQRKANK